MAAAIPQDTNKTLFALKIRHLRDDFLFLKKKKKLNNNKEITVGRPHVGHGIPAAARIILVYYILYAARRQIPSVVRPAGWTGRGGPGRVRCVCICANGFAVLKS